MRLPIWGSHTVPRTVLAPAMPITVMQLAITAAETVFAAPKKRGAWGCGPSFPHLSSITLMPFIDTL